MTLCKIVSVKNNVIDIDGIDAFPDTPVLDIKPHVPRFDCAPDATIPWWLQKKRETMDGPSGVRGKSFSSEAR